MRYEDFKPTVFDHHYEIEDREHWLVVPVIRNRDSRSLEQSNFIAAANMFGIDNVNDDRISIPGVEIHRFGHWGCGWLEILIVEPTPENQEKVDDIMVALSDYPVLDENNYYALENEAMYELWESLSGEEKADYRYQDYKRFGEVVSVGILPDTFRDTMGGEV